LQSHLAGERHATVVGVGDERHRIASPRVVAETIDGEAVVIDLASGTYYSLVGTAAAIWDRVLAGCTTAEVADEGAASFPDSPEVADAITVFIGRLAEERLVEPHPQLPVTDELTADPTPWPAEWTAPEIDVFTDMQDLILLDPVHDVDPSAGWPTAGTAGTAGTVGIVG
jgi:hypothetical protein